jgi:tRNA nucleotidyltransferase (CCA-adding enzyme)
MTLPEAPGAVRWIVRTLEEAGHDTWAVGGAVRDALAGIPSGDWDLTTRATPRQVRRLFRRTVPIGIDHGTVGVLARDGTLYEVTTFRKDVETTGRHAVVSFAETLDEDLARRDFTINAVAWHPLRGVFHDPYGGRTDLEEGVVRTVGPPEDRFAEDYLRILRALRFAGRFRFRVDGPTWRALCTAVDRMGILSPERVREELEKVLEETAAPRPPSPSTPPAGPWPSSIPSWPARWGGARGQGMPGAWLSGPRTSSPGTPRGSAWPPSWPPPGGGAKRRGRAVRSPRPRRPRRPPGPDPILQRPGAGGGGVGGGGFRIPRTPGTAPVLRRWLSEAGREGIPGALRVVAARLRAEPPPCRPGSGPGPTGRRPTSSAASGPRPGGEPPSPRRNWPFPDGI